MPLPEKTQGLSSSLSCAIVSFFGLKKFIRGQYKGRSPSNLSSNFMQNEGLTFLLAQS